LPESDKYVKFIILTFKLRITYFGKPMISLEHLRYFLRASQLKNIALAAKHLHISPSAISQAIAGLERDLDTKLTTHQRNRFELTDAGKLLLQKGESIILACSNLQNEMNALKGMQSGEFTLMTQQSLAGSILPPVLRKFTQKYPKIKTKVLIGTRDIVLNAVDKGTINVGLSVNYNAASKHESLTKNLFAGNYVLVSTKKDVDLKSAAFIMSEGDSTEDALFLKLYENKYGNPPKIDFFLKSWTVCADLAASGLGIAFVPEYVLKRSRSKDIHTVPWPFKEAIPYSVGIYSQPVETLCACSRIFIDFLAQHFDF
jgi:DNA-binding transcriptional LysR family regulator